jgi:hypothetical protein
MRVLYIDNGIPTYMDGKEIKIDGTFAARCSVCFVDKQDCLPITYQNILDIYKREGVNPHVHAVCQVCLKKNEKDLFINIMDYVIVHEIWRWGCGAKDGLVKSEQEFRDLLEVAHRQGVLYREEKRIRQYHLRHERNAQKDQLEFLLSRRKDDYQPNLAYQDAFRKLYEQV